MFAHVNSGIEPSVSFKAAQVPVTDKYSSYRKKYFLSPTFFMQINEKIIGNQLNASE